MALMYDMETVNKAMTEAAKLYDPKHKSAKRVKKVLDIFAGMQAKDVAVRKHAIWVRRGGRWECTACGHAIRVEHQGPPYSMNCVGCGARMDGEEVEE